jgi:hypothetical protein
LFLLLIGFGTLQDLGGEEPVPFQGDFPAPLPLGAELAVGIAFEALGHGREQKAQRHADAGLAGLEVNYTQNLIDARRGSVIQAAAPKVGGDVIVYIGNVAG